METEDAVQPEEASAETLPEVVAEAAEHSEYITHPAKLMRIASMTQAMLNEVRQMDLDAPGRRRLQEINDRVVKELCTVLSEDLREELSEMFVPLDQEAPSDAELRIAQAQLVGWLEGLFNGIHAAVISQQMMTQGQIQQMKQRRALEQSRRDTPGQYL